jgi:hypothetical protein
MRDKELLAIVELQHKHYKPYKYGKRIVTKNMALLLDTLLNSFIEKNNKLIFAPGAKEQDILATFTLFDIIDCYEHLLIDDSKFAKGICDNSKEYVVRKNNIWKNRKRLTK